jgi:hypothetical protein
VHQGSQHIFSGTAAGASFLLQASRHHLTHHEAPTREPLRELSEVERRKKKIRIGLTHDIFESPLTTPNSKTTAKTARDKIINSSPSTHILIEDSFELAWDTPRTKKALLDNYRRVEK